ncbi:hypothetical protein [Arthrobacter sp. zg-Y238]|uniref:hypothetical protein n=1 Tax=Arthrobacter sp. zg-Y238 TaxID=2964614 RepID=UPI0021076F40|nr:hypothetical protein [Arthrobacter sp. zg-Y238]MCQ1953629.1 hypothetical protein [Arthrobacter sp. zg-Y238]
MTETLYGGMVVVLALGIALTTHKVRDGTLSSRIALAAAISCSVGLLGMVLTDWPWELLNTFWADHSVLTSLLSSILLVGLVFLVYERGEQRRQEEMVEGLTGAGVGGMVDHVIDVEAALAILVLRTPPDQISPQYWAHWRDDGKPLRWLRSGREILTGDDPRKLPVGFDASLPAWGHEILDQSIRRLLSGMRDWAPLIGASKDGTSVLLLLSEIRVDLMSLHDLCFPIVETPASADLPRTLDSIRVRLRVFALCFEEWSGAQNNRPEILSTFAPLVSPPPVFRGTSKTLSERLERAVVILQQGQ